MVTLAPDSGGPDQATRPRSRPLQSVRAVAAGFVVVVVLSIGTDILVHALGVYPPWDKPMNEVGDNLLALSYRCVYAVLGSYVTAALAPSSPMRHVWIGASVGFVLSLLGIMAALNAELGPLWYPVALALLTFPCAWLDGRLHRLRVEKRRTIRAV